MISRIKASLVLLLFLGVLLSIPITAKTLSAHGAIPALATGLLVIASVLLGPLSFVFSSVIEANIPIATAIATDLEVIVFLVFGLVLFVYWLRLLARGAGHSIPYLPVTGWALLGVYFCILQVFSHIT